MKKKLIIIGAGGLAKSVIDSLDDEQYEIVGFIDSIKEGLHQDYPIIGHSLNDISDKNDYYYFIAIGDPDDRALWLGEIKELGLNTINVIDKTAIISKKTTLGSCIYIGKMAIINSNSQLEDGVIINTRALIEHGNYISYCANISTNAVLNGDVHVGERAFIGSCSVVNGQINIGYSSIVGSGSVVIRNVPNNVVVVGIPTKVIKIRGEDG